MPETSSGIGEGPNVWHCHPAAGGINGQGGLIFQAARRPLVTRVSVSLADQNECVNAAENRTDSVQRQYQIT